MVNKNVHLDPPEPIKEPPVQHRRINVQCAQTTVPRPQSKPPLLHSESILSLPGMYI